MNRQNLNRPSLFPGRCCRRQLNLALVFFAYFVLLYISSDRWMCAFVVLDLVFPYQAKRLAWRTSPKWPIMCCVERKTTTQSISLWLPLVQWHHLPHSDGPRLRFAPSGWPCARPAHVVQWSNHLGAMCSRAWRSQWPRIDSSLSPGASAY